MNSKTFCTGNIYVTGVVATAEQKVHYIIEPKIAFFGSVI